MITLLTDFGNGDGAVASMKGVIKSINPSIELLDISHDITPFSIREGAFVLKRCYSYFPAKTIFLAVIDPSVGSERNAILLVTDQHYFIAPDNGLLSYIAQEHNSHHVYQLTNKEYHLSVVSHTFHGRDLFASVAAHLSLNFIPSRFGEPLKQISTFEMIEAKKINDDIIEGEIIYFDHYGNAITNIKQTHFGNNSLGNIYKLVLNERKLSRLFYFSNCYSDVSYSDGLIYFGSIAYLEVAICQGSFKDQFQCKLGDKIRMIR